MSQSDRCRADTVIGTIFGVIGFTWLVSFVVLIVSASAPFVRFRRSTGDERLQLKWIASAVIVSAAAAAVFQLGEASSPDSHRPRIW